MNQAEQFSNWLNYLVIACYIYLLVPSRVSRKKTAAVLAAGSSAIFLLNCLLFLRRGQALDATFNVLTIVLPMVLLSLTFAKYRDARTAFSVVAACSIMMGVGIVGEILKNILSPWWEVPLELALHLALLTAIARVFREQFFSILERFRRPWLLLTAVPLLYCKIFDLLVESPGFSPYWGEGAVALLLVICAMMATYVLLLLLFHQLRIQLEQERANQVLMTQVEMMKAQEQAILSSEARIRIYRHDLRHYLQIADEHLRGGRYQEARQIVNDLDEQASKSAAVRCYCKNLTVNAALSVYLRQAEEEGIAVHSALEFPDPLPAEELELAVVLANAAENALHACQKMPVSAQRSIVLSGQVVGDSFLLEVANTYQGQIAIDPKSELPFAEEEEHGIGTKSMLAFARKYGILIDCSAEGGWFVLRLLFQMGER
ncbi:ATP-binding protein [Bittarella massiliensis (ex Durand et al. 2017)]|uniref:ATP-binding protein n=1 Tax=Bittarella massiliensis (ex Durand et al. 2017) TaxID=1720313 RepID=UPI001AA0F4A7|nr:sensor histidine kinase [Bittarella massiliensis (ex Durand et al. 2017)]